MIAQIRRFIKSILPAPVERYIVEEVLDGHAVKSYSQEGEDRVLARYFEKQQGGFYVDVGALHPRRFSNTMLFYSMGWRGITIEPNPNAIPLFAKVRPRDIHLCVGIAEQESTLEYYAFNEPALNTFDGQLARKQADIPPFTITSTKRISVKRLDTVLREHLPPGTKIDFLSVDVEGLDEQVLRSNSWTEFRPTMIVTEALESSLSSVASLPIDVFLREQGYRLFGKTCNSLFYERIS
jgi:FkbM family methyltransferase